MTYAEKHWGNCDNAVAYQLNFVQLCYGYDSDMYNDYYKLCEKCCYAETQKRDYEYPKGGFSKKDYYLLDTYDSGVSQEMMEDIIAFGVAKENFRPIFTRKHDIVLGYQLTPVYTLSPISEFNGYKKKLKCKNCGRCEYDYKYGETDTNSVYNRIGFPVYISDAVLKEVEEYHLAKTLEYKESVIISLELYNYLLKKYPRIECRPVFLGDVTNDPEFLRLHKNRRKFLK